ncbi:winged helix DNA-binding domain-containing protein [Cryptosporangium minutisporangium]|uniref:Winged helix DNA-binding domain-containing protein n=1 Tax=Cryptosporangium minutisporangium TaxID=113569 RepID=A0ABP6T3G2_9ACTN
MSDPKLTWTQVHARRSARHGLTVPQPSARPADAARAMCGAHAQVLSAAELSIGLRLDGATRADVRAALWEKHELVKTFGPRGTVHLLATEDLPVWIAALSALPAANPFPDGIRFTAAETDAVVAAIGDALADAELTTDELGDEVVARTGPWAGERTMPAFGDMWPRWRQVISAAAHRGVLCFGPNRGRKITYTSPRRYLPDVAPLDGQDALAQLVRWYLTSYGPATPHHFAQWINAPRGWATTLFGTLGDEVERVDVEGTEGWVVAGDTAPADEPPGGLRLLPYFDAYQVGCHPRDQVFPGPARERALAGSQAGNYPVLLIDGVVAGVWHLRRSGRRLAITVEPLRPLTAQRLGELDGEVARVGAILEGTPTLTVGPVAVGPHA